MASKIPIWFICEGKHPFAYHEISILLMKDEFPSVTRACISRSMAAFYCGILRASTYILAEDLKAKAKV